jgi:hypothetical protein
MKRGFSCLVDGYVWAYGGVHRQLLRYTHQTRQMNLSVLKLKNKQTLWSKSRLAS